MLLIDFLILRASGNAVVSILSIFPIIRKMTISGALPTLFDVHSSHRIKPACIEIVYVTAVGGRHDVYAVFSDS